MRSVTYKLNYKVVSGARVYMLALILLIGIICSSVSIGVYVNRFADAAIDKRPTDDKWYVSVTIDTGYYPDVGCNLDQYGYCLRNCTSYTAQRLGASGVKAEDIRGLGNGGSWYDAAKNKGISRGTFPKVGAAAIIPGSPGHVAFVTAVHKDGRVDVSSYDGSIEKPQFENNTDRYSHFVYFSNVGDGNPVTGDKKADIIAIEPNSDGSSRYMFGKSNGTSSFSWGYTNLKNMGKPQSMQLGDVTGDGKADIVAVEVPAGQPARYMLGKSNGNGTFSWSYTNLRSMGVPYIFCIDDVTGN